MNIQIVTNMLAVSFEEGDFEEYYFFCFLCELLGFNVGVIQNKDRYLIKQTYLDSFYFIPKEVPNVLRN